MIHFTELFGLDLTQTLNSMIMMLVMKIQLRKVFYELVGGKIFLKSPKPIIASPYIILGIGKQLTKHSSDIKDLFDSNNYDDITGDDYDDYYEKINSPFFIFGKGGAEYFYNSSISITAEMELLYEKSGAKRNYTYISRYYDGETIYHTRDYKIQKEESAINQSSKIGLNLYF